ncbi:hypothetical protein [Ligilactobacillus equi]|uniref:hypothetical protein n=1 Tax=Ligilactobacillus equi TaxID=137357 RepID=UPI000468E761|nr:hypothetical protein [Ligilactobacillus equi]
MRQPSAEMQKFINKHNGDPMNIKKHKQATKSKAIVPTEAFNLPTWFEDGVFTKGAVNKKGVRSLRGVSESSIKNIILILKNDPKAPKPFYDEFSELLMYADDKADTSHGTSQIAISLSITLKVILTIPRPRQPLILV